MPLLDRERMPVLFTVTTSAISGLIVTGMGGVPRPAGCQAVFPGDLGA